MANRYIRRTEVEDLTGLSRSTIDRMMDAGQFPRPIRLTQKAVGWKETDSAAWLESRPVAA